MKKRVLIISHDKIGTKMGGVGIRYHNMAELLSKNFDVTVGFFTPSYVPDKEFKCSYRAASINVHEFESYFANADYVVSLWLSDAQIAYCNSHNKVVVFDIYAPVPVENLAQFIYSDKKVTPDIDLEYTMIINTYRKFLANGDLFLCSNRRHVDFWQGFLFAADQVVPSIYQKHPLFDRFVIAPMGIDSSTKLATPKKNIYKGLVKGIKSDDIVMVWNGGIYDWYDGVTLIDAMNIVAKTHPHIKMVFPSTEHPNPDLPKWGETIRTQQRADQLGLTDKNVFFFKQWFPYEKIMDFLLAADIGIYSHKPSIETEFAHRTRVLDQIRFGLPSIVTDGDYFADYVRDHDLGMVAKVADAESLAQTIIACSDKKTLARLRKNNLAIRPQFDWKVTLKPLEDYLLSNPKKAVHPAMPKQVKLESQKLRALKRITPKPIKTLAKKIIGTIRRA